MKNDDRRWELILKELNGTLSQKEAEELQILQTEARQRTRLNSYGNKVKFINQDEIE